MMKRESKIVKIQMDFRAILVTCASGWQRFKYISYGKRKRERERARE
jgi:hypothetical protein